MIVIGLQVDNSIRDLPHETGCQPFKHIGAKYWNIVILSQDKKTFVVYFIYFTDYTVNKVSLFKIKSSSTFSFHIFLVLMAILSKHNDSIQVKKNCWFSHINSLHEDFFNAYLQNANLCTIYGSWFQEQWQHAAAWIVHKAQFMHWHSNIHSYVTQ
jgi:hypothetical protein